ncbi:MAG TPA: tRNA (N6-isopentenyl adenosine(37)-C2)-methylthiotransferase MiaB [Vicinamibacterales bacterium]|nr:tRNA (N6-isopentenyl adenosine(37)-C2)-methylthiotransferase MiaB [Vicinamibacterales bacterium]HPW21388.1 tRNA (N6-isopentenyl adenosine(37)-C2)-methylthiotransferase MiaB [Vicinamibacterales bacterium]
MPRRYHIETFGCQMNVHDSERLAALLEADGYERAEGPEGADLVVLNTCAVREKAEEKVFSRIGELRAPGMGPTLVAVAGCLAQQAGAGIFARTRGVDIVVGTRAARRLPLLAEEARRSGRRQADVSRGEVSPFPPRLVRRSDPVKAYVTVIEGCNEACAFCVVPRTRGGERMRPVGEILAEAADALQSGRTEIHLLGQIVNRYRAPDDPACDFAELLARVDRLPGLRRIRFASPHPRHVSERLIEAMSALPRVCRHLHLPVQSGSNRVLAAMRRRHTREDYLALVAELRARVPGLHLSTDVIVGFPGEAEADFQDTLSLVEAVGYHSIFSFKYSERPGTLAAAGLRDDVPDAEKARRLATLQARQGAIQSMLLGAAVGTTVEVLVEGTSRRRVTEMTGRTSGNTVVNFPGDPAWVGAIVPVTIERAGPHSLWGRVEALTAESRTPTL